MILFYRTADPYGCFSNFAPFPFVAEDEKIYITAEHYYQAQKYAQVDMAYYEKIRKAKTPKEAAKLGREKNVPMRTDWLAARDQVMYHACFLKFSAYQSIRALLVMTGEEELVEDSSVDWYWGWGSDHTGENKLGKILMQLRSDLKDVQITG